MWKGVSIDELMADNERISVLIDADLKQQFEGLCKVERRSMSAQIVMLVEQAVKQAEIDGKIPTPPLPTSR
jgi:hypothetical protein